MEMFVSLFLYLAVIYYCVNGDDLYVLNFDSDVYVCTDPLSQEYVDASDIKVERYNETTSCMSGSFFLFKGLAEHTMLEILIDKELTGYYEMIVSHEICDICKEIEDPLSQYAKYLSYFGFSDKCPFEAAAYKLQGFTADDADLPLNAVNCGRYQATIKIYENLDGNCKKKTFIGCVKLDFIIEPLN